MLYTHHNAHGATVVNMDAAPERIDHVTSVETATGEVVCIEQPTRLDGYGKVLTRAVWFRAIHPIPDAVRPWLFHCYGQTGE